MITFEAFHQIDITIKQKVIKFTGKPTKSSLLNPRKRFSIYYRNAPLKFRENMHKVVLKNDGRKLKSNSRLRPEKIFTSLQIMETQFSN